MDGEGWEGTERDCPRWELEGHMYQGGCSLHTGESRWRFSFRIMWSDLSLESESESRSVWLFATPWTTPWTIQSMEFSRPEYWRGWPFHSPEDLPNPGIEPRSPSLQVDSLPVEPQGKPRWLWKPSGESCRGWGSGRQSGPLDLGFACTLGMRSRAALPAPLALKSVRKAESVILQSCQCHWAGLTSRFCSLASSDLGWLEHEMDPCIYHLCGAQVIPKPDSSACWPDLNLPEPSQRGWLRVVRLHGCLECLAHPGLIWLSLWSYPVSAQALVLQEDPWPLISGICAVFSRSSYMPHPSSSVPWVSTADISVDS